MVLFSAGWSGQTAGQFGPAFQFRREELSTDSSTHLKKSPLSSASERCSAGDRVQFQRLKCSIREVRASGPGFRSSSCCAPNPCREIVQREETAASARRWHRSGQKVAAMAYPASAMQSKARRTLCLSGRTGPSRAAGDMGLPHLIILAALLVLSQTSRVSDWRYRRTDMGQAAGGTTRTRTCHLSLSLAQSPIRHVALPRGSTRTGWRMANRSWRRLLYCLTSPTICQAACGRDSEHAGLSLTVMTCPAWVPALVGFMISSAQARLVGPSCYSLVGLQLGLSVAGRLRGKKLHFTFLNYCQSQPFPFFKTTKSEQSCEMGTSSKWCL